MRYINIAVNGLFAEKSSKNAGVQGEGNSSALVITFDDSWEDYSKRIIWRDAHGENPVSILFAESYLQSNGSYIVPIPSEPLELPGWCSFTIEGYAAATPTQIAMTVTENMQVLPAENYYAPAEPTPSQAMQLQEQIDNIELTPGPTGPAGPRGPAGAAMKIKARYASLSDLQTAHPVGEEGDAYAVGYETSVIYIWDADDEQWESIGIIYMSGMGFAGVGTTTGTAPAFELELDAYIPADGDVLLVKLHDSVAGTATLSINGADPIAIYGAGGSFLRLGAGLWVPLIYHEDIPMFIMLFPVIHLPEVFEEDPSTENDQTTGSIVGDLWFNKSSEELFICTDDTEGAAVWTKVSGSGGGGDTTAIRGSSTFNGYSTGRVISHSIGSIDYDVRVTPTADPSGQLGEVWVIKGETSCTIKNSGSATTAFDYVITPWPAS